MSEKFAFIGLGAMGGPLALHLARSGAELAVFDLDADRLAPAAAAGARAASSLSDAVQGCDIVFICLPASREVRAVLLGEDGVLAHVGEGTLIVDTSTVDPETTDEIAAAALDVGCAFADSPIGRTVDMAEQGKALFMVGATSNDFGRLKPALEAMSSTIHHCGGPGSGIRTKLVNNFLAIAAAQLSAEALALGAGLGLDVDQVLKVVLDTTATNGHLARLWPVKVLVGDIEPGFSIDLAFKDMCLVTDAARQAGVPIVMGGAARESLNLARKLDDFGAKDFSALLDVACAHAGLEVIRSSAKKD
jgi:4-hydroxybutyrate dehydrogenase/sulfolactaldehyde 3-reductase